MDSAQTFQVLVLAQHLGLEAVQTRLQRCQRSQIFSGTDQPEGLVLRQTECVMCFKTEPKLCETQGYIHHSISAEFRARAEVFPFLECRDFT
jgi:hypothetical protein